MLASSPSWLGIGAQRCGTTWFVDLLTQHESVGLSAEPADSSLAAKELHLLDTLSIDIEAITGRYASVFEHDEVARGEFTPSYLRSPWAANRAKSVLSETCVIIVLVRDPVERFESAMNLFMSVAERQGQPFNPEALRLRQTDAVWAGFYDEQLRFWQQSLPANPFLIIDYAELRRTPQVVVDRVWSELRRPPQDLRLIDQPSASTVAHRFSFDSEPGLRSALIDLYTPSVKRLTELTGLCTSNWLDRSDPCSATIGQAGSGNFTASPCVCAYSATS